MIHDSKIDDGMDDRQKLKSNGISTIFESELINFDDILGDLDLIGNNLIIFLYYS